MRMRVVAVARGILLDGLGLGDDVEDEVNGADDVQLNHGAPDCAFGFECLGRRGC